MVPEPLAVVRLYHFFSVFSTSGPDEYRTRRVNAAKGSPGTFPGPQTEYGIQNEQDTDKFFEKNLKQIDLKTKTQHQNHNF